MHKTNSYTLNLKFNALLCQHSFATLAKKGAQNRIAPAIIRSHSVRPLIPPLVKKGIKPLSDYETDAIKF